MIKLKDIYNLNEDRFEDKKPIKEFALTALGVAFLMKKFILPWLKKNPELKDELQNEIEKVNVDKL
tara:strand:- start:2379 stop:2576 length:198 start_codon:yes stop_codon:yes gene_type:complete